MVPGTIAWAMAAAADPTLWQPLGANRSISGTYPALTTLSENRIALSMDGNLRAYDFDGASFSPVGSSLALGMGTYHDIGTIDENTVITVSTTGFPARYLFRICTFDGSDWALASSFEYGVTTVTNPTIEVLSPTLFFVCDQGTDRLRAFTFDGLNWNYRAFLSVSTTAPHLARLTDTTAVLVENAGDTMRAISWNGSSLSQVGNVLTYSAANTPMRVAAMSENRFAWYRDDGHLLRTYDFNGTDFVEVGDTLTITTESMGPASMTALTETSIAIASGGDDILRAMEFVPAPPPILVGTFDGLTGLDVTDNG